MAIKNWKTVLTCPMKSTTYGCEIPFHTGIFGERFRV